ncbi:ArsR family transcriptional regulator [Nonomuraea longispora]|uniref:ArsR family transcriptional regulator n=2 Tax=Nonomuraea longispora TaxID=1848320 RepID=A0A4R4N686_9ACTN|nr:ArsR family transcriptional regulator [Nonomuraea longispora]
MAQQTASGAEVATDSAQCCPADPQREPAVEISPAVHAFLKALANPIRQRIMLLFARGAELSVNQVAELARIGQPRASEQLAELKRGGILTSRKQGKVVLYRADKQRVVQALADLQEYMRHCC